MSNPPVSIVRPHQVIVCALAFGVVVFMGIVVGQRFQQGGPVFSWENPGPVSLAGLGATLMVGVAAFIVPRVAQQAALKQVPDSPPADRRKGLAAAYLQRIILGAALLEGGAFFNLIAYMVEHFGPSLLAALLLLFGILAHFPSEGRFDRWCDKVERDQRDAAALGNLKQR